MENEEMKKTAKRTNFLRRTKATSPPDTTETDTADTIDTTTNKYSRRAPSQFKSRKESAAKESTAKESGNGAGKVENRARPSLNGAGAAHSERPTRNFVRRRLGGANGTAISTSPAPATVIQSRRPFRVASRRRPGAVASTTTGSTTVATTEGSTTTGPTSASPSTAALSEESLQDIGDTDSIEDPTLQGRVSPKKTAKVRRPLVLKAEEDQNPSATNEDERKRQSKKYSASFKQNQLDEVLRQKAKSSEEVDVTTEWKTTVVDDYSAETALAIAAHQLLAAPIPSIPNYEENTKPTRKSPKPHTTQKYKATSPIYTEDYTKSTQPETTQEYKYTNPIYTEEYTDGKTLYSEDFTSTPIYKTTEEHVTSSGAVYNTPTIFTPRTSTSTVTIPKSSIFPSSAFTTRFSKPTGFSTSTILSTLSGQGPSVPTGFSRVSETPSTVRYLGTSDKLIPVPVEDYGFSTGAYSSLSQEPSFFTREYLLESPVTKTYDDEYQYLSPITTPQTTTRKIPRKTVHKRISTTLRPTINSYVPSTTAKPRRNLTKKPFDKIPSTPKSAPNRTYKPIENYDYYDDSHEKMAGKYEEGTKVVLHARGNIECLDIGNFPHPSSCKKFISCARLENGSLLGWEYVCPKGLSFDPVGGICNWSAGLGCDEKDI